MNKNIRRFIAAVTAFCVVLCITIVALTSNNSSSKLTQYTITAQYDDNNHTVKGNIVIEYTNTIGTDLPDVCLHLYPNAYNTQQTAPFEADQMSMAYPNGFVYGGIELNNVKINGDESSYTLESDNQIIRITPVNGIKNNKQYIIECDFNITLPNSSGRLGYCDDYVELGNWYPVVCKYENGWRCDKYCAIGDPFYTDCADYSVALTVPQGMRAAFTGSTEITENGNTVIYTSKAEKVRDFAAVLNKGFNVLTDDKTGTTVNVYYTQNEKQAQVALNSACDAIALFNELYGKYPYGELDVVQSDFFIGGMEYPGLVMIDKTYFNYDSAHSIENVTVHETAHQWWYAAVGNDQINSAYIDEGLATFSTMQYYKRYKPTETYKTYFKYYLTNSYKYDIQSNKKIYANLNEHMERPLSSFEDSNVYNMLCYTKAALMFNCICDMLGEDQFYNNIKMLYNDNLYGIINTNTLMQYLSQNTAMPITDVIKGWLDGNVILQ